MSFMKFLTLAYITSFFPILLEAKTATLKIYSPLIDYEALFRDDDAQLLSYNLLDAGIQNNEVRVSGSMMIEGVYATFTGNFTSPFSNIDTNFNGIYDFFEIDNNFRIDVTGSASYSLQGYGDFNANIFASISRTTGQHSFNLNETVTVQSSNIDGIYAGQTEYISESLTAVHALGTIYYDEDQRTYTYYLGHHGTSGTASGSGSYQVNSDSSITFSELSFPSINDNTFSRTFPALSKKTLTSSLTIPYIESNKFHVMTSIQDVPYFIIIEDNNDGNADNKPDLLTFKKTSVESVDLNGWNYHAWPWIFNVQDQDWLYYHFADTGCLVWRNKTQSWLSFNPQTSSWVSLSL